MTQTAADVFPTLRGATGCRNVMAQSMLDDVGMNTVPRQIPSLLFRIFEVLASVRQMFTVQIPVGYQAETGFHYGVKPFDPKATWPPVE